MKKIIVYTISLFAMFLCCQSDGITNSGNFICCAESIKNKIVEEIVFVPSFLIDSNYINNDKIASIDSIGENRRRF